MTDETAVARIVKKFPGVPIHMNLSDVLTPATLDSTVATAAFKEAKT